MSEEEFQKIIEAEWEETLWCVVKWGALGALIFIAYKALL